MKWSPAIGDCLQWLGFTRATSMWNMMIQDDSPKSFKGCPMFREIFHNIYVALPEKNCHPEQSRRFSQQLIVAALLLGPGQHAGLRQRQPQQQQQQQQQQRQQGLNNGDLGAFLDMCPSQKRCQYVRRVKQRQQLQQLQFPFAALVLHVLIVLGNKSNGGGRTTPIYKSHEFFQLE